MNGLRQGLGRFEIINPTNTYEFQQIHTNFDAIMNKRRLSM